MKSIIALALVVLSSTSAFAKDASPAKRKPATTECAASNKELAQSMINNAAKRISSEASDVSLSWTNATSERYVYSGSIQRASYEVIIKTDSSCFPLEAELVDLARK